MFKLTIILLLVLIVGDRNRSLAGISKSVSQSEDLQARCNGYCFSSMRSMMDFIVANQDQWNTCKAIIANDTRADQNQVKAQLSGLQETVTGMQNQQQILSKDFEDRLGRLDSQMAVMGEVLTNQVKAALSGLQESVTRIDSQMAATRDILTNHTIPVEPKAVTTEKIAPPNFELIGSRYFYIEQNLKLNWYAAAHKCREMGGHLATFKDREELLLVQKKRRLTSDRYWTGINCLAQKNDHVSLASGKTPPFFNWASDEPDVWDSTRCVYISNSYFMRYIYCSNDYNFICQADDKY